MGATAVGNWGSAGGSGTGGSLGELQEQNMPMELESDEEVDQEGVGESEEPYTISAVCMEVIMGNLDIKGTSAKRQNFTAMVDMGANIGVAPRWLAEELQLEITEPKNKRTIGTAKEGIVLVIEGWISPPGYSGMLAIVEGAMDTLLAVIQMQSRGMGVRAPPNQRVCHLTVMDGVRERDFMELPQQPPTNLYYVDIRVLIFQCTIPTLIPQSDDYRGSEPTVYDCYAGVC